MSPYHVNLTHNARLVEVNLPDAPGKSSSRKRDLIPAKAA